MTLVLDASAVVAALVESRPEGVWAETAIIGQDLAGPEFVLAETTNILRRMELAGDISPAAANRSRLRLLRLNLRPFGFAPFADRIWELRHNLTSYDAWYVALAEWLDCPLVTLDLRLSRASGPRCEFLTPPTA